MGYLQDIDAWLNDLLSEDGLMDEHTNELDEGKVADAKRAIKQKILESYRNGQGQKPGATSGRGRDRHEDKPPTRGNDGKRRFRR
jgi:hypothetical protein